jgi:putative Mn2+ efflux pump MntP
MFDVLATALIIGFVILGLMGHVMLAHALMTDKTAD